MIHRYEVTFILSPTVQFTRTSDCYYSSIEEFIALNPRLFKLYGAVTQFKTIASKPRSTIYTVTEEANRISELAAYYAKRSNYASYDSVNSGF